MSSYSRELQKIAGVFNTQVNDWGILYSHHDADINEFLRVADLQPHETVLDIGCGIGNMAIEAASKCQFIIGIDIAGKCVGTARRNAKQKQIKNAFFELGDFQNSSQITTCTTKVLHANYSTLTTPHRFDVVLLCWSFHYVHPTKQTEFLKMLRSSVLKSDGRIVLTTPDPAYRVDIISCMRLMGVTTKITYPNGTVAFAVGDRIRVSGETGIEAAKADLKKKVKGSGWVVERGGGSNMAFPTANNYTDCTAQTRARAMQFTRPGHTPGQDEYKKAFEFGMQDIKNQLKSRMEENKEVIKGHTIESKVLWRYSTIIAVLIQEQTLGWERLER